MPEPIIHIIDDDSEADTCRKYVLPKLKLTQLMPALLDKAFKGEL